MEQKYFSRHQQQEAAARPLQTSYLASPAPTLPSYPAREREVMLADINKLLEEVSSKHNDNIKGQTRAEILLNLCLVLEIFDVVGGGGAFCSSAKSSLPWTPKKGENCTRKHCIPIFISYKKCL